MKYAIVLPSGVTEIREDNYKLPDNAVELTDEQHEKFCNGELILQNGQVIANPITPKKYFGDQP